MAMAGTDSGFRSRYACAEPGMTICMGRAETSFSCFDRHPRTCVARSGIGFGGSSWGAALGAPAACTSPRRYPPGVGM